MYVRHSSMSHMACPSLLTHMDSLPPLLVSVCVRPSSQPQEIYVDDESKLTLHGLVQHYIMLHEDEKNRKLNDLLDALDFNQVSPLQMLRLGVT